MSSMNRAINRRAVLAGGSSAAMAGCGLLLLTNAVEAVPLGIISPGEESDGIPVEKARAVVVVPRRRRRVCWWRRGRRVCTWR